MKNSLFLTTFLVLLSCSIAKKKTVVFIGDSITEEAVKPGGFIRIIESYCKQQAYCNYKFTGAGISGNKVNDLNARLKEDVFLKKPDVVIIYIGINDVWNLPPDLIPTNPDQFQKSYHTLIAELKAKKIKIILCTPGLIGEKKNLSNAQDVQMDSCSNFIRALAKTNELGLIDLRRAMQDYNLKFNIHNKEKGILTTDGVHLTQKGNELVAGEMWKVIQLF